MIEGCTGAPNVATQSRMGAMSHSGERCPTCDGTRFITRGDKHIACPTCSHASNEGPLYVDRVDDRAEVRWRQVAIFLGAATLIVALAFLGWLLVALQQ